MANKQFLEPALKRSYLSFAQGATSATSAEIRERVGVQAKCIVELCGIDLSVSYRIAFGYIRQLALHLRTAMAAKTPEAIGAICSWQYMHCLRLWGAVLSTHPLEDLDFPLIQIALGVMSVATTARLSPLRVHCVDIINRLCRSSGLYAPVSSVLLQTLSLNELHAKKTTPSDRLVDISILLKFKADALQTANARASLISSTVSALHYHLVNHRSSISFPELWFPIRRILTTIHFSSAAALTASMKHKKKKHHKKDLTGINESAEKEMGAAWRNQASTLISNLIREADSWASKVKSAREGITKGTTRVNGPADVAGCAACETALKAMWKADDEKLAAGAGNLNGPKLEDVADAVEMQKVSKKTLGKRQRQEEEEHIGEDEDSNEEIVDGDYEEDGDEDEVQRLDWVNF